MIKPNPENCENCPHLCAYHSAQLQSYTTQHGAILIIFPPNLQTSITAQILSIRGEGIVPVKSRAVTVGAMVGVIGLRFTVIRYVTVYAYSVMGGWSYD